MVHVQNAADAHLLAESALFPLPSLPPQPNPICHLISDKPSDPTLSQNNLSINSAHSRAAGGAYFITNGEPVVLWEWVNQLLTALGEPPVTRHISLRTASAIGAVCEAAWRVLPLQGEPPMTRFIAAELAKDHWFSLDAARRDLGYTPRITMAAGTAELIASLRNGSNM